jgi:RNA polymerase sigma-70 factor (ECF subfamily)
MARSEVLPFSSRWFRPATAAVAAAPVTTTTADVAGYVGDAPGYVGDDADDAGYVREAVGYVRPPDEQASIYFREHSGAVFRYLAGVFQREEDAEEVTQEAFLRLHQALVARADIESPRAWTLTVARRLMLDRLRHEHSATTRTVAVRAEVLEAVRDSAPSPEDTLAERRRRAALSHAVRELSDLERQCLFARAEGLTLKEIGEAVNMDLRRVAEVVARSVRTLQGRLRA